MGRPSPRPRGWFVAGLVTLWLGGCKPESPASPEPEAAAAEPAEAERALVVTHRGASADAPENTLAAFRLGFEQGADAIEGDFWLSRDGVIVSHHDRTLERSAGDPRAINELSAAELGQLDVGSWGPWADGTFAGEPIPTLDAVLDTLPAEGSILIEVKDSPALVEPLLELLDARVEAGTLDPASVAIIAFDPEVLRRLSELDPSWTNFLLVYFEQDEAGAWHPTLDELLAIARELGTEGIDMQAKPEVVTAELVAGLHAAGLECHVWTVDDPEWAKTLDGYGVDSITTNVPARIRAALESD